MQLLRVKIGSGAHLLHRTPARTCLRLATPTPLRHRLAIMAAAAWVLVICVGLVVCSATATEPAQRTAQLFIATSDDRIVRLDEWRQQEVRGWRSWVA